MADLLGPASAPNAVTVRPADTRVFGPDDTFFQPCSSPDLDDGTEIAADWLNGILVQSRGLIRGNGNTVGGAKIVTEDNADDAMMLRAVQHLIQRGQMLFGMDSGSADAMVVTLSPAPAELKSGMVVRVIKGNNANLTTTPTLKVNSFSAKTVVRRSGGALLPGDLEAQALLELLYDGTNFRVMDMLASDIAAQKSPFNVVQFVSTTRTVLNGSGFLSFATGTYTKKSATSDLIIRPRSNLFDGGIGANAGIMRLAIASNNIEITTHSSDNTTSSPAASGERKLSGIGAGAKPWTITFGRNDATPWRTIINPTNADAAFLAAVSETGVVFAEVEP